MAPLDNTPNLDTLIWYPNKNFICLFIQKWNYLFEMLICAGKNNLHKEI